LLPDPCPKPDRATHARESAAARGQAAAITVARQRRSVAALRADRVRLMARDSFERTRYSSTAREGARALFRGGRYLRTPKRKSHGGPGLNLKDRMNPASLPAAATNATPAGRANGKGAIGGNAGQPSALHRTDLGSYGVRPLCHRCLSNGVLAHCGRHCRRRVAVCYGRSCGARDGGRVLKKTPAVKSQEAPGCMGAARG
jgi:hypothetical protein